MARPWCEWHIPCYYYLEKFVGILNDTAVVCYEENYGTDLFSWLLHNTRWYNNKQLFPGFSAPPTGHKCSHIIWARWNRALLHEGTWSRTSHTQLGTIMPIPIGCVDTKYKKIMQLQSALFASEREREREKLDIWMWVEE